jgi:hypothetical protein
MGYEADGDLESLFPETFVEEVERRVPEEVGDDMLRGVKARTPVARIPAAYGGNVPAWIADRDGRKPGTLRDSWELSPVLLAGDVATVAVESEDPVAVHVEESTRPHLIRARSVGALRFPSGGDFVYRRVVHHPGTQGQHMLRDTMAEIEVTWQATANRVIEEIAAAL